jgi:nucleoside-diphosphate-sugar epimerase
MEVCVVDKLNSSQPSSVAKQVVVTGGAGAIGSRLVRRVLAEGADSVIVIDDLSSGYDWLLPEDERVRLVVADVCDLPKLKLNVYRPLVFHLAAFFANQNSVDHPLDDLHTNAKGTLTTLVWSAEHEAKRLVYASAGCSIAGHGIDAPIREDMPVSLHLDTPYQITKALGEFYCNYFNPQVGTARMRFFNSYGPGEVPGPYRNVIPNFIWRALHDQPLVITGTGEETRDFIYVDDLVDGLIRGATLPAANGEAFNLGTGIQTRIIDLARMIIRECNSKSAIEYAPRRPWDKSARRQADIGKAVRDLDFQPKARIEQGIVETVRWYRDNRERIEALETVEAKA